ncbi:MAG: InlB B-repeat-containing protein [Terracidiphilus sp.]
MKKLVFLLLYICTCICAVASAQTVTINGGTTYQTMDGFGGENGGPWSWASYPYNENDMDSSTAANLFSASSSCAGCIGISIYRIMNVDGTSSTLPPDMASAEEAIANGAQVELSMQSPPSSMKYNGEFYNASTGASGSCLSASNSTYATYIVQLIQNMANNGVPVTWLDVQNEPGSGSDGSGQGMGTCDWSAAALDSFVKVLGPALSTAGLSPKVMLGSMYDYANSPNYFGTCLADSSCNQYVSIYSGHGYGYPDSSYVAPGSGGYPALSSGKHLWQSETADMNGSWDPNMDSALTMAENMQSFLQVAQISSYNWWELMYIGPNSTGSCADCNLIGVDANSGALTYTKRFYAFGNFSKFIRPGQVEIAATQTPQSGVHVTAFKNTSTGAFEIVAVNGNGNSVSQPFSLSGLTASSVTPYLTDPNNNLDAQSNIAVSNGAFSATLTADSVTTFVSSGSGGGVSLTVETAGTGSGTVSGTNCSTGNYTSGTEIGACTANPGSGSTFAGWTATGSSSCSGTGTCAQFALTATTTLKATFSSSSCCTLTVATNGTGSGTINTTNNCVSGTYPSGTGIGICTATPNSGSTFTGWASTGSMYCSGTGTCGIYGLTSNGSITATFASTGGVSLTVSTAGTGSGTVSGTDCATGSYASGTEIGACTATANSGSTFAGWTATGSSSCSGTGACAQFDLTATTTLKATFNATTCCTLAVSTAGTGSGTVNTTNNCASGTYASGTAVGLCTATPNAGSTFTGWTATGALWCTGQTGACGIYSLTANSTLVANFAN